MQQLLAYADRWSVAPSEAVNFHVSSPTDYSLSIVRLRQPDAGPLATPFKPEPVDASCNGTYRSRIQSIPIGSSAVVPQFDDFTRHETWTLAAFICPTTPAKGRQAIVGTWDESESRGAGLEITEGGALGLRLADKNGSTLSLSLNAPLRESQWYFVAAVWSGDAVTLTQRPVSGHAFHLESAIQRRFNVGSLLSATHGFLTMAAWPVDKAEPATWGGMRFGYHFNGRVEAPKIALAALDGADLERFGNAGSAELQAFPVLAAWDFCRGIEGDIIEDVGPRGWNGVLINLPARAVTGRNWTGDVFSWRGAPEQYGAIHFHDDDLVDARWQPDVRLEVPATFASGIYAAHLRAAEQEFWVPFVVRPPRGTRTSDAVFILPTTTYIAYLNHRSRFESLASERLHARLKIIDATDMAFIDTPEMGLSCYDVHSDRSGVAYSSRLRPAVNFRPTGHIWNFCLDLFLTDWLQHIGYDVDILTDEDLHREGAELLAPYRVALTGSHPEYVTTAMLNAMEHFLRGGGRLMYLGGNGFYWRTAFDPLRQGVVEVRRSEGVRSWDVAPGEQSSSFTGENMGTWRKNGRPPQLLVGVGYVAQGFDQCAPYDICEGARNPRIAWAFDGVTGAQIGDRSVLLGGAAGIEIDATNPRLGTPAHALVIARSCDHTNAYELASEEVLTPHGSTDGISNADIRAEIVFFETPHGGAVFSVGSIAYLGALNWNAFDNDACRLTTNVLQRFLNPEPFAPPPP